MSTQHAQQRLRCADACAAVRYAVTWHLLHVVTPTVVDELAPHFTQASMHLCMVPVDRVDTSGSRAGARDPATLGRAAGRVRGAADALGATGTADAAEF